MGGAIQHFAQVVADGADVSAPAAADGHQHAMVGSLAMQVNALHVHLAQGNLHGFAPAGTLVHGHAILLDGAVHAGPLPDIADEPAGRLLHALVSGIILSPGHNGAGGVLGIGGHAKCALGHIFLFLVHQIIEKPGGLADHNGQHAGGLGVKGAGMAHTLFPREAADGGHHRGGGHARGLEDIQKSVHSHTLS